MKATEIRDMTQSELNAKLADLKAELFNLRFQHAINQLDNPMRIKAVKKKTSPGLRPSSAKKRACSNTEGRMKL